MNQLLATFSWPPLPGSSAPPQWDGRQFLVGGQAQNVLCYEAGDSHWSPELTEMHEAEAGSTHPIDRASRALAIQSLEHFTARRGLIVLDVGCSSGFLLEEIRQRLPEVELIGSDFIAPPLQALARRLPGVPLLQFDLRQCPLPDVAVGAITALNVLEHIDDDAAALGHIFRVLKPGGIAHLEVPAGPHLYDIYDEHLMHHRRYTLRPLQDMARAAGFEILKATHLGAWMYPAFAWVKRKNRRLLQRSPEEKKQIVAGQIHATSQSALLRMVLRAELVLGRRINYRWGIRCVLVLRKPARG